MQNFETMRKLMEETFTVIDLETTGGRPESNGIFEIGMVKIHQGKFGERFSKLLNPGYPIPPIVRRITGVNDDMVMGEIFFKQIAKEVVSFIDCDIVVLHNGPFDLQFLSFQVQQLGYAPLANPILCTVKLGERLSKEAPNRKLETLAAHHNVSLAAHHRAWSDAEATANIFLIYLSLLQSQGVETFPQLYRWLRTQRATKKEETRESPHSVS